MSTTLLPPGSTGVGDAFGSVLASVRDELSGLVDTPTWSLDEARLGKRLGEALALRASADELIARLVGEVDDRGTAKRQGASSTRAHLMASYRMSGGEASRVMRAASAVHGPSALTEPTRRAQAAGRVSSEQAVVIATAINRLSPTIDPATVEAAQADLLDHAGRLTYEQLQLVSNHVVEVVDPDGADAALETQLQAQEKAVRASTELVLRITPDGTGSGWLRHLPALQTAMLVKALDGCTSPRRGDNPLVDDGTGEPVPHASRLGLALCELIEHLPVDELPQHGVANASIVVTVDEDMLRAGTGGATLDTGGTISISETRRLACNAGILPLVLSGESRVLDLGMARRLFDRYQRIALAHRDRGCVFPRCDRTPARCEAHHITFWSDGGPTDLVNGCLLCPFHHHLIHQREWDLLVAADGMVEVIPPARIDPARRPVRHERFKPRAG